jgi:hypothetical protein
MVRQGSRPVEVWFHSTVYGNILLHSNVYGKREYAGSLSAGTSRSLLVTELPSPLEEKSAYFTYGVFVSILA